MRQTRGTADTKRYDLFKALVALGLLLIIVILLLRGERFQDESSTTKAPAIVETTAAVSATPTSAIEATSAALVPTFRSPEVDAKGKLSLMGAGTPGSTVEIWAGGQKLGQASVNTAGNWTFNTDLMPGEYDLTARAVDDGGAMLAESETTSVTVPEPITAPTFGTPQVEEDGKLSLIGAGMPGSTVEIWANGEKLGEAPVDAAGDWTFNTDLAPGAYDLTARAVDDGGAMLAESEMTSVTVPEPITAPTFGTPQVEEDGKLSLIGAGMPGSTVEIWANGEKLGEAPVDAAGNWMFNTDLAPGEYKLAARAVDEDGATLAESEPASVEVPEPITAPTLTLPEASPTGGKLLLIGTGTPDSIVEIRADGEKLGGVSVDNTGMWKFDAELVPGEYELTASVVDEEGQMLAESETLVYTMPEPEEMAAEEEAVAATPTLELPNELVAGQTATLSGSGTPGREIEILDDGVVTGTATVGNDGTWSYDYTPTAAGAHALAVRDAKDAELTSETVTADVAAAEEKAAEEQETEAVAGPVCGVGTDQGDTYVVAPCEYMALIAQRLGVELAALIAANPQIADPNLIYPGQVLNVPR